MNLAWGKKVSPTFAARVIQMCHQFGWELDHASWLMSCMAFESGETFSPSIRNAAGSGAVGLIQFMPSTAFLLNTTAEGLAAMSAEDQLYFVSKYFTPYASRIHTLSDMYMAILLPKYIGKSDDAVLFSGGISYRQNSGLDTNKDGIVTKLEASAKVQAKLARGLMPAFAAEIDVQLAEYRAA